MKIKYFLFVFGIIVSLLFIDRIINNPVKAELYEYKILRVLDGDTIEFEAPFLPVELKQRLLLRITGIDTPEKGGRAKCTYERNLASQARLFVENKLKEATKVKIYLAGWDKFGGRVLGDIMIDDLPLSQMLIKEGYAVVFYGNSKRISWCNKPL